MLTLLSVVESKYTHYHFMIQYLAPEITRCRTPGTCSSQHSTTDADVNDLSTNYLDSLGADNTDVNYGAIDTPSSFGEGFDILLGTPFICDPTMGNLLLTVTGYGVTPVYDLSYDRIGNSGAMSRFYDGRTDGDGLVTGFNQAAPAPVPDSATMLLFGTGLVGYRKRKNTQ